MLYRFLADAVVVLHGLFIVFTVLGGLLVLRWHWVALLHLPAAAWGVIVQVVVGGRCPLTPLENYLRDRGHEPGIGESFIDHYVTSLIYVDHPPDWLHPTLGAFVLTINLTVYGILITRWLRRRAQHATHRELPVADTGYLSKPPAAAKEHAA
jgi:hypothetical protein